MIDKTINIYSTFQTKVISGGRYLVWILANNLANHGFKVNVIVDNTPIFTDFFERNENIKIIYAINNNFLNRALNKINYYFPF